MKYKVGDRVRIHSLDYLQKNHKEDAGGFRNYNAYVTYINDDMLHFCSKIVTISNECSSGYNIIEDSSCWTWDDWMIEGKVSRGERVGNPNIVEHILKAIGVEDGQIIVSNDSNVKYRLSETNGLEVYEDGDWRECGSFPFNEFIKMVQLYKFNTKWIPSVGTRVYFMSLASSDLWDYTTYDDTEHERDMVAKGLYFKTQDEAIQCAKQFLAMCKKVE